MGKYPSASDQAMRRKTNHKIQWILIGISRIYPIFADKILYCIQDSRTVLGLERLLSSLRGRSGWSILGIVIRCVLIHEDRLQSLQPCTPRLVNRQARDEEGLEPVPESDERICERTDVHVIPNDPSLPAFCKETSQNLLVLCMIPLQDSFQSRVT